MGNRYEIIERKLLSIPRVLSTVDPSIYRKAAIVSSRLPDLVRLTDVANIGEGTIARLIHPLSEHYEALSPNRARPCPSRSSEEALIAKSKLHSGDLWDLAVHYSRDIDQGGLRRCNEAAQLQPWADGIRVQFPPIASSRRQITELRAFMADDTIPPIIGATVVLAALLNMHPFKDGNGRVARMMFNVVCWRAGMPDTLYLPLKEMFLLSKGGFEIRLRQLEINNDWNGLLDYICNVINALGGEL